MLKSPFLPSIKKDKKALKQKQELEDLFSVENTILFRKMAQYELQKELKSHSASVDDDEEDDDDEELMRTELYKELELNEEELNPWEGGQPMDVQISVDFFLGSFLLMLKKKEQRLMSVCVDGISLRAYKRKSFLECWSMIRDVKVLDDITAKTKYSSIVSIRPRPAEAIPTTILAADMYQRCKTPFFQTHIEIPGLDNSCGMRVNMAMETMDIIMNVPWLLEVMKFLVPENIVVMSAYEEKAYNLITSLRNGDSNILAALQSNKGMELNVNICPMNLIIPNYCTGHRSKSMLLICQLGELEVTSKPNKQLAEDITQYDVEDLYNTMSIRIKDVSVGLMDGRMFANRDLSVMPILSAYPQNILVLPFTMGITMQTCIVNEVRYKSMRIGISIGLVHVRITSDIISSLVSWSYGLLPVFVEKQKELDIDLMKLLLQPKQLLFSCIVFDGSPYLEDHSIEDWKASSSKQQRILYQVIQQQQKEYRRPLCDASDSVSSPVPIHSPVASISPVPPLSPIEEPLHGVVHLTYEDLLLLQYKPSMEIEVQLDELRLSLNPQKGDSLLDISLQDMAIHYLDHMYDMDVDITVPTLNIFDNVRKEALEKQGIPMSGAPTLVSSSPEGGSPFLKMKFCSVGELSMLNEVYRAATNMFVEMGVVNVHANASAIQPVLSILPEIPPFPALTDGDEAKPPADPAASPAISAHPQEAQMDMHVRMQSALLDVLRDDNVPILTTSMTGFRLDFTQATEQTHISMGIDGVKLTDLTRGAGKYPDVLSTSVSPFLSADILLVNSSLYNGVNDTTIKLQVSAPVLVLRMRFVNELLEYLKHGSVSRLLAPQPAPTGEAIQPTAEPTAEPTVEPAAEPATEPAAESTEAVESVASVHSLVDASVNGLFASLVQSNIIREVVCEGAETTYVLPKADVCIQNIVVLIPSSSSSDECLRFEMGEIQLRNSSEEEVTLSKGAEKLLDSMIDSPLTTQLLLSVHGICMESQFMDDVSGSMLQQNVLHRTNIDVIITLSSVLKLNINLSPIVMTLNQSQLRFLVHRLLPNFAEQAVTEYPKEEESLLTDAEPVKEKPAKKEPAKKETKEVAVSRPALKLNRFFVDLSMSGFVIELLRERGGYTDEDSLKYGTNPLSLVMLKLDGLYLNLYLNQSVIQLNLLLMKIGLCDTRANVKLMPLFLEPVQLGDAHKAALSFACFVHDTNTIDIRGEMGRIRVFAAPLFMEMLSIVSGISQAFAPSDSKAAESEEELSTLRLDDEIEEKPVEKPVEKPEEKQAEKPAEKKALSPFVASLLPNLHIRFAINPIAVYLASSFTEPSSMLLLTVGLDSSIALTSSMDVSLMLKVLDLRLTQCDMDDLMPVHDVNDILQSWNCDVNIRVQNAFQDITVSVTDASSMIVSVGYRDLLIATHCLDGLKTDVHSEGTAIRPFTPDEPTSSFPILKLPTLVSASLPFSVNLDLQLHPLQVIVVNDVGDVEVPFVLLRLQDLHLSLDYKQQLVFLLTFSLSTDFYNLVRVAWEPLLEPWELMVQMVQRSGLEENRIKARDAKSSVTIHADHIMNLTISTDFCSSAIHFLRDLARCESTTTFTNGYYMSIENKLDLPCTFEVIYDGGTSRQLEALRSQWSLLDRRYQQLLIEGLLYVCVDNKVEMRWVELLQVEPRVRVYSAFATEAGQPRQLIGCSAAGSLLVEKDILFSCEVGGEKLLFLSTNEQEIEAWRQALQAKPTEVQQENDDSEIVIPAGGMKRTTLPAHPSSLTNAAESYNQRIVALRVENFRRIEFCCDSEGDLPFSLFTQSGEYCYDIVVRLINRNGLRVMMLIPMLWMTNFTSSPVLCEFAQESMDSDTPAVHQSQRKQVNLEQLTDNYFGVPVSFKSPYYDSVSRVVSVGHGTWRDDSAKEVGVGQSLYCPLHLGMKGRCVVGNQNGYCSLSIEDITSLNFRRICLNIGSSLYPHYVLVRSVVHSVESESLKALPIPPAPKAKSDILEKLNSQTVNGVVGNVGNRRSLFEIVVLPVLVLKNLLPIDLEYHVVMYSKGVIETGMIASGQEVELACIDGANSNQYGVQLRPTGNQFVWNQGLIPVRFVRWLDCRS